MNATPRPQATASANSVLRTPNRRRSSAEVEQADRRRDDDGRQDRLRHRLDQAGHDEEHREHQSGCDETGQLGLGARLGGNGRPRAARAHREPREEPCGQVGRSDPGELLVAVDLVAPAPGEAARGRDRVTDGDERDPQRGGEQQRDVGRRHGRQRRPREALREHPDHGNPVRREVEHHRQPDRDHDGDEDAGCPRRHPHETQDDAEAQQADAERPGVRLVEALDEGHRFGDEPARVGAEPEQLGQLADEDHDRETRQVAGPDRVREQVGDEAELGQRPHRR